MRVPAGESSVQSSMIAVLLLASIGQTSDGSKEEGWQPIFQKMAEDYSIQSLDSSGRTFQLRKTPIMRWSQPVRGGDDGAIFAWMDQGRPAAVGTIFAYPNEDQSRTVVHEFHSLAGASFKAVWRNTKVWQPAEAGIKLNEVPGAPEPADKPAARLTQMRAIMRDFTARSIDPRDQPWELRLLPQPLVRYEPTGDETAIDGALFAFAQGTDPEILFVLEAQPGTKNAVWKYGCGRFSDYRLELKHKDNLVWEVGRPAGDRTGSYFFMSAEVRQAPAGAKSLKNREQVEQKKE